MSLPAHAYSDPADKTMLVYDHARSTSGAHSADSGPTGASTGPQALPLTSLSPFTGAKVASPTPLPVTT